MVLPLTLILARDQRQRWYPSQHLIHLEAPCELVAEPTIEEQLAGTKPQNHTPCLSF